MLYYISINKEIQKSYFAANKQKGLEIGLDYIKTIVNPKSYTKCQIGTSHMDILATGQQIKDKIPVTEREGEL